MEKQIRKVNKLTRIIGATAIGGFLEMYDFAVYAFFAVIFGPLFFPAENHVTAILAAFAVFAIGYLARPIGGVIAGYWGDKYGRKKTLIITMLLMAIPTFLIGILPTYQYIGILAPLLLVLFRLLQGLAVGGDFPGAITFIFEHGDQRFRSFRCSWLFFGINVGLLFGSFISWMLTHLLSHSHLIAWGWRVPFLLGVILAITGFYIRKHTEETPLYTEMKAQKEIANHPVKQLLAHHMKTVLKGTGATALPAVVISQIFIFMPTFLNKYVNIELNQALLINSISILFFSLCIPLLGLLADRMQSNIIPRIGALLIFLFSIPVYQLFHKGTFSHLFLGLGILSFLSAMVIGPLPGMLANTFITKIRYTGIAIAYNFAFAIFGGLTPLALTYLLNNTSYYLTPAFFLMIFALLSFISIPRARKKEMT